MAVREQTTAPGRGHIVLIGMMGSGKTTVGAMLAERLGRRFVDTDHEIELRRGMSIAEIFDSDGEESFRVLEAQVVGEVLSDGDPAVISLGGGAVLDPVTRDRLAASTVVWLDATTDVLLSRIADDPGRPLLAGDAPAALGRLSGLRDPVYRGAADLVVDADGAPDEVVDVILAQIAASTTATMGTGDVPC